MLTPEELAQRIKAVVGYKRIVLIARREGLKITNKQRCIGYLKVLQLCLGPCGREARECGKPLNLWATACLCPAGFPHGP